MTELEKKKRKCFVPGCTIVTYVLSRNTDEMIRHPCLPCTSSFLIYSLFDNEHSRLEGAERERGLKGSYAAGASDLGDSCDWLHPGTTMCCRMICYKQAKKST
ncbi:hypothetical protein LOAG_13797 [Loa loa]|uniref:Uncharacterized protein n=1 Tax=Loa loa TaxID=7209 RepID=A0A1S0TIP5_LOALO|nr:hypothetical protein LOAG_13797 [Loa loa]EFO14717.1 hypothetical protein LOAG_13797 [Loa loa]